MFDTRAAGTFAIGGLLSLSVLFAGCSGSDDNDVNGGDDAATATTSSNGTPASATGTATEASGAETPTPTETGSGNASPLDRLREAAAGDAPRTLRVVYEVTMDDDEVVRLTFANRPPHQKVQVETVSGSSNESLTLIVDGESSYFCTSEAGAGQCIRTAGAQSPFGSIEDFLILDARRELWDLAEEEGVTIRQIADRTIAGEPAECFAYTSEDGDGEACISKQRNIVLVIDSVEADGSRVRMEVVDFSESPSDADFEPPYPIIDFG